MIKAEWELNKSHAQLQLKALEQSVVHYPPFLQDEVWRTVTTMQMLSDLPASISGVVAGVSVSVRLAHRMTEDLWQWQFGSLHRQSNAKQQVQIFQSKLESECKFLLKSISQAMPIIDTLIQAGKKSWASRDEAIREPSLAPNSCSIVY